MTAPVRYRKLGYVALNVTDIERSVEFYKTIVGLDLYGMGAQGQAFLRCSDDHHNVVLYPAAKAGLKRIGWVMESERELDSLARALRDAGISVETVSAAECQDLRQGPSLRAREPNSGLCFEFYTSVMQLAAPFAPRHAKIARLGHIVIVAQDFDGVAAFMTGTMNFKVSDYVPDFFAFMRAWPNVFHHSFAVSKGNENRLNHVNFMVRDIDDIGMALNRMRANNVPVVFGPGRHKPSDSIFIYFLDPDGMTLEYSFGMEEFPEQHARQARMLERVPATLDTWGGVPTERFGAFGPIEAPVAVNAAGAAKGSEAA
ncbi:MAG: VOC family protein [Alphaproteobacteria bacterium]